MAHAAGHARPEPPLHRRCCSNPHVFLGLLVKEGKEASAPSSHHLQHRKLMPWRGWMICDLPSRSGLRRDFLAERDQSSIRRSVETSLGGLPKHTSSSPAGRCWRVSFFRAGEKKIAVKREKLFFARGGAESTNHQTLENQHSTLKT